MGWRLERMVQVRVFRDKDLEVVTKVMRTIQEVEVVQVPLVPTETIDLMVVLVN
jgi:hypothetical protein